jgi:NhaP-type Na+/H+ or K+/H+ antiporter
MSFELWCITVGTLLVGLAFTAPRIDPLPITTSILYLAAGAILGPLALGVLEVQPLDEPELLERLSEAAVVISVFAAGLKLGVPFRDPRWRKPLRLAFVSMAVTVGLIALLGVYGLGLSWGAAVLLGAVLAPTDPVLASEVEVRHPTDRDAVRFGLTGEAAFNDGTAFPFVMLGLGLLGLHDLGTAGWRWLAIDVVWATAGGLGLGAAMGWLGGRVVRSLRRVHREDAALDDFLALGLLVMTYGLALVLHTYGFLAAMALGLGLRRGETPTPAREGHQPPMTRSALELTDQVMRFAELGMVLLVGTMIHWDTFEWRTVWIVPVLFLVVRPFSVGLGLLGAGPWRAPRTVGAWLGIRGIGSIYYLTYAINHGLQTSNAVTLTSITVMTIAASIVVHGLSATPVLAYYERVRERRAQAAPTRP